MKGFTFIELLLVLGLITALITIFVYFINPVEILKKHRDIQRINDLKALEIAISSYLSANPNADPDGIFEGTGSGEINQSIYVSVPYDKEVITNATITDGMGNVWNIIQNSSSSNMRNIDGNGWVPINFTEMKYPVVSYLPVDPINSYSLGYFYTYVFERKTKTFELNAKLEYKLFNKGETQDIVSKDGGSDNEIYEAGSNKCIIIGNRLYGVVSTTTCKEINSYGESRIDYGRCNNPQELNYGIWFASSTKENIANIVHDKNTSTFYAISPGIPYTSVLHDLQSIFYINKVRIYGSSSFAVGIHIYKDGNPILATTTFLLGWHEFQINTTTYKWELTPGEGTSTIAEMEAYGCPIYWSRYFDGNSTAYYVKRSKEKDGYYYIVAGTKNNDFWLAKLTPDGNIKFATSFGGSYIDVINSIEVDDTDNDGYIDYYVLGGYTNSYGINAPTSTNGYLIKMTTSSNILASQAYGATFNNDLKEVKKSLDGYYFSIGNTLVITPSTTTNLWFLKIATSNLSLLSEIKLGESNETIGNSLVLFDTSTALLSGRQFTNSYFVNFDLINSTTTYTKIYATPTSSEEIVRIIKDKLVSNAILALVKIWDASNQVYYFQIRRIYIYDGSSQLITTYSNYPLNEIPTDFLQNDDGSIIVVGYSRYGNLYPNLTIYKFDPYGRFVYRKEYDQGIAYKVEKAFDLGYIVVGFSYKTNSAWVIHLDENGDCPNCFAEKRSFFEIFANIFKFISQLLRFPPLY
jgi:type II secretory pathway pseudopilin PulG